MHCNLRMRILTDESERTKLHIYIFGQLQSVKHSGHTQTVLGMLHIQLNPIGRKEIKVNLLFGLTALGFAIGVVLTFAGIVIYLYAIVTRIPVPDIAKSLLILGVILSLLFLLMASTMGL